MRSGERRRDTDDAYVKVQRVRVVTCVVHNLCSLEDDTALQPARTTATERDLWNDNPVEYPSLYDHTYVLLTLATGGIGWVQWAADNAQLPEMTEAPQIWFPFWRRDNW